MSVQVYKPAKKDIKFYIKFWNAFQNLSKNAQNDGLILWFIFSKKFCWFSFIFFHLTKKPYKTTKKLHGEKMRAEIFECLPEKNEGFAMSGLNIK